MKIERPITRRSFISQTAGFALSGCAVAGTGLARAAAPSPATLPGRALGVPAAEPVWQVGCYTRPFDQFDYLTALDAIAEAGYRYVGLMTTKAPNSLVISVATTPEVARRVGEAVRQRGLKCVSVYGGDFPVAVSLDSGVQGLKQLIDNCAAASGMNLMLGGTGDERLFDRYYQAVAACCRHARDQGIGLSVKPHGGLNATGPQCRKIIERVGQPDFRVWYDPGNIYYYSDGALDPAVDVASVDGLVVGMSVKDYRPPKEVMVTPGTGQVNFAAVLARLKKGGFASGPLVVETLAPGGLPALLAEARKARKFLEDVVAGLR